MTAGFQRITEKGVRGVHSCSAGKGDGRERRESFIAGAWSVSQWRDALLSSLPPSSWSNSTTAGREAKFPSLCVCKPASFPGQKTEQAAINYKEILSSCGRFATTRVSKANRYGVLGSLVPCTAAMPNPGPQILLQQIRAREEGMVCYLHAAAS